MSLYVQCRCVNQVTHLRNPGTQWGGVVPVRHATTADAAMLVCLFVASSPPAGLVDLCFNRLFTRCASY